MNAGELINHIADRTGYDTTALKDILSNPELSKINLPDDFKPSLNNLLTVKEAQINPDIKKHFTALALAGADTTLSGLMDEYQLPDDIRTALTTEQNTYARIKLFTKALADLKDQHAQANSGDKSKLVAQISELNTLVNTLKESAKNEVESTNQKWLNQFMDEKMNGHFKAYDYANKDVDPRVHVKTARSIFDEELTAKGGKVVYTNNAIKLVSATDDALPFTIDNKEVPFEEFADRVVYSSKMANVKGSTPPPTQTQAPTPLSPPNSNVAPAAKIQISSALEDLRKGSQ